MEVSGVRERTDRFFVADLEQGYRPRPEAGTTSSWPGDVIEHLTHPTQLLKDIRDGAAAGRTASPFGAELRELVSRVRVGTGMFGYDRRGILDDTHLRFFTRSTLRRTVRAAGFDIIEESATGLPLGAIGGPDSAGPMDAIRRIDSALVRVRLTLFGYQLGPSPHAARGGCDPRRVPRRGRRADSADPVDQRMQSASTGASSVPASQPARRGGVLVSPPAPCSSCWQPSPPPRPARSCSSTDDSGGRAVEGRWPLAGDGRSRQFVGPVGAGGLRSLRAGVVAHSSRAFHSTWHIRSTPWVTWASWLRAFSCSTSEPTSGPSSGRPWWCPG